VGSLKRLLIARRPQPLDKPGTSWDLVAERADGPPVTLLSAADDPGLIRPLAQELHRRLAAIERATLARRGGAATTEELLRRLAAIGRWPPLEEEDWPAEPTLAGQSEARGLLDWLLPRSGYTWLAIHAAGSVGLWSVSRMAWEGRHETAWLGGAVVPAVIIQGLIVLCNLAYLKVSRQVETSLSSRPKRGGEE
jgi:hypothetical protein